jgi:YVTN family beta-propeller protein
MPMCVVRRPLLAALLTAMMGLAASPAVASYVLFEGGQVRPLALSPDGSRLFAVNSPDNRLEIFAVGAGGLTKTASVEVGIEPVAVAARNNAEVWVVNHLSDSVSVVDVSATPPRVTRTLLVGDEPRDIVFAGPGGNRAFVTTARRGQNVPGTVPPLLTTEGTPRALVFVFDATDLGNTLEGTPQTIVQLFGDTPRALAVSPDGNTVYAAVFHSGNQTTTVNEGAVCDDTNLNNNTPRGPCTVLGVSMPGGLPNPERSADGAPRPETGLIVKFNSAANQWRDQLNRNWNNAVRFDLPDFDVFKINASSNPPVQIGTDDAQFAHVGTVLFNMVANPISGKVYVSNTEARNEVRFEGPGIIGGSSVRGHLHEARITVLDGAAVLPRLLNKHINYSVVPSPPGTAAASLATPVGLAVNSAGTRLYVAAFGSQKIGVFDTAKLENDTFTTQPADGVQHVALGGGGPTGLVLDEANGRLYVLTRFDNSVRVVNTTTLVEEIALRSPLYNPETASITSGRRFLYDAAFTSSNGEASCASCHVFGDFDSLAWDLGNPDDVVLDNQNPVLLNPFAQDTDFHPMKGPMTTQSLRGMANHGPMHWRGDRTGGLDEPSVQPDGGAFDEDLAFKKFNVAFEGLLGRAAQLTTGEMQQFTDFILQVTYPPNPIRNLDNSLTGAQQAGHDLYFGRVTDTFFNCNGCHVLDPAQGFFGSDGRTTFENEPQFLKVAHLRNMYQKVGMFGMPAVPFLGNQDNTHTGRQVRGFGFLHDGAVDTLARFHSATVFSTDATEEANLEQFMLAFDSNLAPIVGQQTTLTGANSGLMPVSARLDLLDQRAAQNECDVVVKGTLGGQRRGWVRQADGTFRSDRASEPARTAAGLRLLVNDAPGQELTYTCAPPGSGERMGIDRDEDGYFDRDELDAGSDPADPLAIPGGTTAATLVTTKKLLIKNKSPDDESRNKIVVLSKAASIAAPAPGSSDDPRCNADPSGTVKATLALSSATSGQAHATDLPCQNWSLIGSVANPTGYKYSDPELDDGTAKRVIWKSGKQFKAVLLGKGPSTLAYDLQTGVGQGTVQAVFLSESVGLCMSCSGLPGKDGSDAKLFLGKDCPAPVACAP